MSRIRPKRRRLLWFGAGAVLVFVVSLPATYHLFIPLPNATTHPLRAKALWRELDVASALGLVRTGIAGLGGEFPKDYGKQLTTSFHREHDLAEVCRGERRWRAERVAASRRPATRLPLPEELESMLLARRATFLVASGYIGDGRELLESAYARVLARNDGALENVPRALVRHLVGARLRDGETRNCVEHHNPDRCVYPIAGAAVHGDAGPVRDALALLDELARVDPSDVETLWLRDLATRLADGDDAFLLDHQPIATRGESSTAAFHETSIEAGLDELRAAGGVAVDDFDGDGHFDVFVSSYLHCDPLLYYRNRGDGTFKSRTHEAGLDGQLGGFTLSQADADNDGDLDVFVTRNAWQGPGRNSLLENDGQGRFTDVTAAAGLADSIGSSMSAAWGDFDGDGWVDLFVSNLALPTPRGGVSSRLFRNLGDGRFEDATSAAGLPSLSFSTGAAWGDVDDDGDLDLYVSVMLGPNHLFRNEGDGTFTDRTFAAGVARPLFGFATWFWDYDNDGHLDLFASGFWPVMHDEVSSLLGLAVADDAITPRLYRNRGDGTFEDVTAASGLSGVYSAMGANFGDLDSDGFLDFHLGTGTPSFLHLVPNRMFRNLAGRGFEDVTGPGRFGHLQKGHGTAFADLDGDGDQDLVLSLGGAVPADRFRPALFLNPGNARRTGLDVELVGRRSNRAAIGARIAARLDDGRTVHRVVSSGGSFGSSPLRQHVGLGAARRVERIEIRWPSGRLQTIDDVPEDRVLVVDEAP